MRGERENQNNGFLREGYGMHFLSLNKLLIAIITITVVILILIYQNKTILTTNNSIDDGQLLIQAFSESNIDIEKLALNYSDRVITYKDSTDIDSLRKELEKAFSIELKLISKNKELVKYQGVKSVPSLNDAVMKVGLASTLNDNGVYDVYLIVNLLNGVTQPYNFSQYYAYLKQSLEYVNITPVININIQGSLDQKTTFKTRKEVVMNLFKNLSASVSESLIEEEVISLTGFSEKLNSSLNSNNNQINIQIASRFNLLDSKTTFTIGTPIITIEY